MIKLLFIVILCLFYVSCNSKFTFNIDPKIDVGKKEQDSTENTSYDIEDSSEEDNSYEEEESYGEDTSSEDASSGDPSSEEETDDSNYEDNSYSEEAEGSSSQDYSSNEDSSSGALTSHSSGTRFQKRSLIRKPAVLKPSTRIKTVRTYNTGVLVSTPFPRKRSEFRRAKSPGVGYVWISGEWIWNSRWVWKNGYYARRPRGKTKWNYGKCNKSGSKWYWIRGYWQ